MSEPVDTSAEAVERLYTGNRAGSMEHRAFSTKGFRESLGYTVNPKDWVSAADYDRLQSALEAAQQRIAELESLLATRNADAERYQWLRTLRTRLNDTYSGSYDIWIAQGNILPPDAVDAYIDAARSAERTEEPR